VVERCGDWVEEDAGGVMLGCGLRRRWSWSGGVGSRMIPNSNRRSGNGQAVTET